MLKGLRVLVAVAAFDFAQLPHLEEALDAYADLCAAGVAVVDVYIHSTVPYPITLIDLLNTRFDSCPPDTFRVRIVLVSPTVRLHLVDLHRPLFYDNINNYDLFIYTEDDIRVSPLTVSTYLSETALLQEILGREASLRYNVGIVRYEYNFPNVEINDKTRHATQNVTRVYWEHSYKFPAFPKVVDVVPGDKLQNRYVHMKNHHQGMYLATRELLLAWKESCKFDVVTDRPGGHSQPTEGTQRVWMSSQQLYGGRHCNIQQVIPMDRFGALTCLHLPNKNYRRVGHFRNRTFSDGTETFDHGAHLLTALDLHLEIRRKYPRPKPNHLYRGIVMVDQVDRSKWSRELSRKVSKEAYLAMLDRRMHDYEQYVARRGILSEQDMTKTDLVDYATP